MLWNFLYKPRGVVSLVNEKWSVQYIKLSVISSCLWTNWTIETLPISETDLGLTFCTHWQEKEQMGQSCVKTTCENKAEIKMCATKHKCWNGWNCISGTKTQKVGQKSCRWLRWAVSVDSKSGLPVPDNQSNANTCKVPRLYAHYTDIAESSKGTVPDLKM